MSVNSYSQRHEMHVEATYPSGAQEWFCPTCARRFIAQLQPEPNIIELEVGDGHADHVGTTDGLLRIGIRIQSVEPNEPELSDELLNALEEALKNVNFGDWEDTEDSSGE